MPRLFEVKRRQLQDTINEQKIGAENDASDEEPESDRGTKMQEIEIRVSNLFIFCDKGKVYFEV